MVAIIPQEDRELVPAVGKRHGQRGRKRSRGFEANEVRRLKQLEAEIARLPKLVAEGDLEIES
jgi:hypothetical protein